MADKLLDSFLNNIKNPKPKPVKRPLDQEQPGSEKKPKTDEAPAAAEACAPVTPGACVLVQGLVSRPDLNGQR